MTNQVQQNDGSTRPYVVNSGVIDIITKYIYPSPIVAYREGVSNADDQYEGLEKEHEIWITIDGIRKRVTWLDEATGILDMADFTDIGNKNQAVKEKLRGKIGKYHIGKKAFTYASRTKTVKIYSNNGESGDILTMLDKGWGEPEHFGKEHAHIALPHIGLKIEILDAKEELLNPRTVYNALSKWFGILIHRGLKIYIKDENAEGNDWIKVLKPAGLKTDNEVKNDKRLRMKSGTYINCRLEPINKPSHEDTLDVYVRHVYIRSIHSDYLVKGWINCNDLELDAGRDRFIQSQESSYPEFIQLIDEYLKSEGYDKQAKTLQTLKNTAAIEELTNMIFADLLEQFPDENLDINGPADKSKKTEGKPPGTDETADLESEIGKRGKGDQHGTVEQKGTDITREPKETQLGKDKTRKRIRAEIKYIPTKDGENAPSMAMKNSTQMGVNQDRKNTYSLLASVQAYKRPKVWLPYIIKALVSFIQRDRELSFVAWDEIYENMLNKYAAYYVEEK